MAVQELISSGFEFRAVPDRTGILMLASGLLAAIYLAPVGALFAVVILWRTETRKAVPRVAAVTVTAAAVCGLIPWPFGLGSGPLVSIVVTFGAGVLAMLMCAMRWPLESPGARLNATSGAAPQA
jgi:hypothetical protein